MLMNSSSIRFITAEEAVKLVKSGDHLLVGSGCAEPACLMDALMRRAPELSDVEISHLLVVGEAPYVDSRYQDSFRHNAFFIGPNVRAAVRQGSADYTPCFLHEIPRLIRSGRIPVNVAMIQAAPPDDQGRLSLGISIDILKAAVEAAETVIVQINPLMPVTLGDTFIPLSRVHAAVFAPAPLAELRYPPPDAAAEAIARHVAVLVEDGATLQMGIGSIPDAVLAALEHKKDLGIHTEMFSDGLIRLLRKGVITNKRKTLHPGKVVSSFCMGTRSLYELVHQNPIFEFHPSEYVNDPWVIAQNEKMTSINSAIQVDITGQVCADSIGHRLFSGVGGQVDFIRGAARAKDGKAVIALPATAKGGTVSRIVPVLDPGSGVVTTRSDVDFVVTEFGIASLKGRTIRERALGLIEIAHPKFRPWLLEEAKKLAYVYPDQLPLPQNAGRYPVEFETETRLKNGVPAHIRPLKSTDERALRDFFYSHSERTIHMRYGSALKRLTRKQIQEFVTLDYNERMAIGAFIRRGRASEMIGVARYYLDASGMAEMAITIGDAYQGQGLGLFLLGHLSKIAKSKNVKGFTATVLAENEPMLRLFHEVEHGVQSRLEDGTHKLSCLFE